MIDYRGRLVEHVCDRMPDACAIAVASGVHGLTSTAAEKCQNMVCCVLWCS